MLILKVLNGPLYGAELALPDEDCFFRIAGSQTDAVDPRVEDSLSGSAHAPVITIPLPKLSPNFTLKCGAPAEGRSSVDALVFDAVRGQYEQTVELNVPVMIGAMRFALRRSEERWSELVLLDRGESAGSPDNMPSNAVARPTVKAALGAMVCVLGVAAAVALLWPGAVPANDALHPHSRTLSALPGDILDGQDKKTYVIVQHEEEAGRVRRMLSREDRDGCVVALTRREVAAMVERVLDEADLRYFGVRVIDARFPEILRDAPVPEDIVARILGQVPFATDVRSRIHSAQDVERAARRLVSDLGANAEFTAAPDRYVVSINDYLSDTQLDSLGRALVQFRAQWGDRYVHFQVNQRDLVQLDGVKTGNFGYELRGLRHIFFQASIR